MFDILKVLTQHTAFLEKNLKSLDIDQKKSIGIAFRKQYPNATRSQVIKKAMEIDRLIAEHINRIN